MPKIKDLRRVVYSIYEYDPLLDSSNMTMVWIMLMRCWIYEILLHFQNFLWNQFTVQLFIKVVVSRKFLNEIMGEIANFHTVGAELILHNNS